MKVTIKDIAQKVNTSQNTVSKALRGADGVSDTLRDEIIKTASKLGYYKIDKCKQKSKYRILVISRVERYHEMMFWGQITMGMRDTAKNHDVSLQVTTVSLEEEKCGYICQEIREREPNGIIFLGTFGDDYIKAHLELDIPIILVDHYIESTNLNAINTNNFNGIYILINYLTQMGHKKIGFVGNIEWSPSFFDRYTAFLQAMRRLNLEVDTDYLWTNIYCYENIVNINHTIEITENTPTAFVCANDLIAIALIRDLSSQGILIPESVSVVGFDDINMCTLIHPSLTTVRVPKNEMGICAIEEMLRKIDSQSTVTRNILLSTELVERDSVKKI